MTTSEPFEVRTSPGFDRSIRELKKKFYTTPDAVEELGKFIGDIVEVLEENPRRQPPLCHMEPWPRKKKIDGLELWKMEVPMPLQGGAASHGRVVYLFKPSQRCVVLCMIYNHQQYSRRPDDRELAKVLAAAAQQFD